MLRLVHLQAAIARQGLGEGLHFELISCIFSCGDDLRSGGRGRFFPYDWDVGIGLDICRHGVGVNGLNILSEVVGLRTIGLGNGLISHTD